MRLAEQSASGDPFAFGFHSKPSMKRLHLHVISRDYDSASLKTKKHWQSFCTPFFLDVDWVIHHLQDIRDQQASVEDESIDGHLTYDVDAKEAMLKGGIRCHMCGGEVSSLPRLKEHFLKCKAYLDAFAVK
jgi:aprataxin